MDICWLLCTKDYSKHIVYIGSFNFLSNSKRNNTISHILQIRKLKQRTHTTCLLSRIFKWKLKPWHSNTRSCNLYIISPLGHSHCKEHTWLQESSIENINMVNFNWSRELHSIAKDIQIMLILIKSLPTYSIVTFSNI